MRLRQGTMESRLELDDLLANGPNVRGYPIRGKRFEATQAKPLIKETAITQAFKGNQFVIALKENALVVFAMLDQSIDGLARRRPPVDVITEKNINRPDYRARRNIFRNRK
jgi:hypothetical protein